MSCTLAQMATRRACWDDATTKTFLDLCIEQKNLLNYNSRGLSKLGWQNLYRDFKQRTGLIYDSKQLQNKLAQLRRMYTHWRDLQAKTGLGRDRNTGGVAADDSYWEDDEGVRACIYSFMPVHFFRSTLYIHFIYLTHVRCVSYAGHKC